MVLFLYWVTVLGEKFQMIQSSQKQKQISNYSYVTKNSQ